MSEANEVTLVALRALPYQKIRVVGEVFVAARGYGELFKSRGLAREATSDEVIGTIVTVKPTKKKRRAGYERRDRRAR